MPEETNISEEVSMGVSRQPSRGCAEIVFILDKSGSMSNLVDDVIGGLNSFLENQARQPGQANFTLVQFSNSSEVVQDSVPLTEAMKFDRSNYIPGGGTALLDAMGKTINRIREKINSVQESDRPEKVIVLIMTDGEENTSREFNRGQINQLISDAKEMGWEFVFLGANQDAISEARNYGISMDSALTYASKGAGVVSAMSAVSEYCSNTRMYARAKFSEEDRIRAMCGPQTSGGTADSTTVNADADNTDQKAT